MQITGAFLAQYAEIKDQRLNVTGGVFDGMQVPAVGLVDENGEQLAAPCHLVILMQAGPDDHEQPYRLTVEAVDIDESKFAIIDKTISVDAHHGENRFLIEPIAMIGGTSGRRVLIVTIGDSSTAIPLHIDIVQPEQQPE